MTRKEILDRAAVIVGGKDSQHGNAENNFDKIARLWYAYKGVPFSAKDVAVMMILLKVARIASGHQNDDNWTDIAGYAACGGELEDAAARAADVDTGYQD